MEANNLNLNMSNGNSKSAVDSDVGIPRMLTSRKMKKWISDSGIDEYTKRELIKKIDSYPANTMKHFYKNIHEHIRRIHAEKKRK